MDGAMGRGRGRGRAPQREPPRSPSNQDEEKPDEAERARLENVEQVFHEMYVAEQLPPQPDSDRGRTRGRGAGRGRGPAIAQGATLEIEEPSQARAMGIDVPGRFDDAIEAPESPKEAVEPATAVDSPPSVREEQLSAVQPPVSQPPVVEAPEGTLTVTSGPGSTNVSSTRKRKESEEEEIISRIGTKGEPADVKTNYLRLKLLPDHPGVVEYHVSIEPHEDHVGRRRKIMSTQSVLDVIGSVRSFDGTKLFLPQILANDVSVVETSMPDNPDVKIRVVIKFEMVKEMKDAVMFFNILLHKIMRVMKYQELRREYYDLNMISALNQHKLEIWPGLALNAENQEGGLMICVDTCSRVIRQDTVYDWLKAIKGDPNMKKKFEGFIVNKIVITKYNYKTYKIDDVEWSIQPSSTFPYKGKETTFVDYVSIKYPAVKDQITDLDQPMLMSKLKPRKNEKFASEERVAALIPQFCYITGLTEEQKADFKVMTDLAASTRLVPAQRMANLDVFIRRLLSNPDVQTILSDWGLMIERDVIEVRARRVEGPNLEFNSRIQLQKAPPDFSREAGKAVFEPIAVRNYVVLCTQRDSDKAKRFIDVYKEVAGPLGIKMIQGGKIVTLKGMRPPDFSDALKANCHPDQVHFAVIIMPMSRDDVYSAIKRHCVANVPIPSQCIVSRTLGNEKRLRSIVLKIALQINCKLGGSLWALRIPLKENVMFIGIDAAHDPLKKDASVICLVATLNNECTKYFSKSSTGKVHQELADHLRTMTISALNEYRQRNGKYPNRIVVFRDGGSLGAVPVIETTELDQMKRATDVCGDELKDFTFVLVTKRIAQRFFAKTGREKFDNPAPGTIVDNVVTRRHFYDFYVVSQQVRQGTVNPTHFLVMNKQDPIKPDLIQRLAYVTCFMYYNWSGTVRVPAMVQYAHKLSALLIRHVKAPPHKDISNTLYYL